jgi:hypothetical protein
MNIFTVPTAIYCCFSFTLAVLTVKNTMGLSKKREREKKNKDREKQEEKERQS